MCHHTHWPHTSGTVPVGHLKEGQFCVYSFSLYHLGNAPDVHMRQVPPLLGLIALGISPPARIGVCRCRAICQVLSRVQPQEVKDQPLGARGAIKISRFLSGHQGTSEVLSRLALVFVVGRSDPCLQGLRGRHRAMRDSQANDIQWLFMRHQDIFHLLGHHPQLIWVAPDTIELLRAVLPIPGLPASLNSAPLIEHRQERHLRGNRCPN